MAKVDETGAQRVALGTAPDGGAVTPVSAANPLPVSGGTGAGGAMQVQGVAANGQPVAGNPVFLGAVNRNARPTVADGQISELGATTTGHLRVAVTGVGGAGADGFNNGLLTFLSATVDGGDGTARLTGAGNFLFNGTTWDRARGDASGAYVNSAVFWTEASANQAASATLNGTLRANGGAAAGIGSRFEWFVAEAFADVAGGTLYIDKSIDAGTTWRQVGSIALVAGTSVSLRVPISAASYRARHVNGANATTAFLLTSGYQT